jgi:chemotaxis protein CheY-P-specific phosphatase CheC
MGLPRVCKTVDEALGDTAHGTGWSTGVFFQLEGCLDAMVGILFQPAASEALVRRVTGQPEGEIPAHCIESALMEVGNILASHVASAIADTLGERLLPSIPELAMNHAQSELRRQLEHGPGRPSVLIECELKDGSGDLGGLLILAPREPSDSHG